jgi:uncharacterized protein YfcZ (UPF0381/DUF406 family)
MRTIPVIALVFLALFSVLLGYQIYLFYGSRGEAMHEYQVMEAKASQAKTDRDKLRAEIEYFSHPENLEKELRARFNYRRQDEKMFILVPGEAVSTSTGFSR